MVEGEKRKPTLLMPSFMRFIKSLNFALFASSLALATISTFTPWLSLSFFKGSRMAAVQTVSKSVSKTKSRNNTHKNAAFPHLSWCWSGSQTCSLSSRSMSLRTRSQRATTARTKEAELSGTFTKKGKIIFFSPARQMISGSSSPHQPSPHRWQPYPRL